MAETEDGLGPVSYMIVEFPGNKMTGDGFVILLDLVDRGLVRVLDFKFAMRDTAGGVQGIELADIDHDGTFDLAVFKGVSSGMLDDTDLADAAEAITPGSAAAILVFENRWAKPFVSAVRRSGAELVAAGYIPHDTLAASLDATEAGLNGGRGRGEQG